MTVTRFQQKRGTSAEWAARTTPLLDGEIGVDKDTGVIKMGDGFALWAELPAIMESEYLPILGKAKDSYRLDGLASTDFLRSNGKAVDADKLDGYDSTYFMPASAASSFLPATGKAVDADKLDGNDSTYFAQAADLSAATAQTSATRKLVSHWGAAAAFPTTGVLVGDTCVRTDVGTGGSLWVYVGGTKGVSGWVHKGPIVCTSATRPAAVVSYEGLDIFETDTKTILTYSGTSWKASGVNGFPVAFLTQEAGGQSLPAAWTNVTWDHNRVDTHGGWTSGSRWNVPSGQEGTYRVSGVVSFQTIPAAKGAGGHIAQKGAVYPGSAAYAHGSFTDSLLVATPTVEIVCVAGDYIELQAYNSAVTTSRATGTDGFCCSMSIERIR